MSDKVKGSAVKLELPMGHARYLAYQVKLGRFGTSLDDACRFLLVRLLDKIEQKNACAVLASTKPEEHNG